MLIVRLYGDDVDAAERSEALALVADCSDCATLFADLGAIADATRLMPTAARPRDFSLTEADAARLNRRAGLRQRLTWLGVRRSFGGALATLGLVGVLLTSASTALTPSPHFLSSGDNLQAARVAASEGPAAVPAPATPAPQVEATAAAGGTGLYVVNGGQSSPPGGKSAGSPVPATSPAGPPANGGAGQSPPADLAQGTSSGNPGSLSGENGSTATGENAGSISGSASNGIDQRQLGFLGFGLAFLLGLGLLLGPRLLRLTSRRFGR
jgi:hypothetical protein